MPAREGVTTEGGKSIFSVCLNSEHSTRTFFKPDERQYISLDFIQPIGVFSTGNIFLGTKKKEDGLYAPF